jgi:hypothetical protein
MYRQGDVMMIPVRAIPAGAKPGPREDGRIVLAHGEVTGHAHAIEEKGAGVFEHEGTRYVRVPREGALLRHEEHGTITVPEGAYEIRIQKEFAPQEHGRQAFRNVLD